MFRRKVYGESKIETCPFCDARALAKNKQGVPVCVKHKASMLPDMKCACNRWLDMREGKWGPFFICSHCGTMSFNKVIGMNPDWKKQAEALAEELGQEQTATEKKEKRFPKREPWHVPKETTVRSDELDFL